MVNTPLQLLSLEKHTHRMREYTSAAVVSGCSSSDSEVSGANIAGCESSNLVIAPIPEPVFAKRGLVGATRDAEKEITSHVPASSATIPSSQDALPAFNK